MLNYAPGIEESGFRRIEGKENHLCSKIFNDNFSKNMTDQYDDGWIRHLYF